MAVKRRRDRKKISLSTEEKRKYENNIKNNTDLD